jgi:deleted-in-malignant-brain-tumors protein 1
VEICISGEWETVCDAFWDVAEASVVCRELGYRNGLPITRYGGITYQAQYSILCTGDEARLYDCNRQDTFLCNNVGVICYNETECNDTDVRLVDGVTPVDGRVEICLHGLWGSVCDDDWAVRDAAVVCHQLGYGGVSVPLSEHRVLSNATFYHLDDVACTGNENLLADCGHAGVGEHNCIVQQEEAGVICNATVECSENEVRLMDGLTPDDGRVEICLYGLWGSVCDDAWDYRDARVVCQQLGYNGRELFPIMCILYTVLSFFSITWSDRTFCC